MRRRVGSRKHGISAMVALLCASGAAQAQSSVTLYGSLNGDIRWENGTKGGATWQYDSSLIGSFVGLTGVEDLGGGVAAIFKLESQVQTGNGAGNPSYPSTFWYNDAYVGVKSRYGTLTLGRQLNYAEIVAVVLSPDQSRFNIGPATPLAFLGANIFSVPAGSPIPVPDIRFNNTALYSNKIGGLTFGANYAFGNSNVDFRAGSNYSTGAYYQYGTFLGGIAYERTYSVPGALPSTPALQYAENFLVGGQVQAGPARLFLNYLQFHATAPMPGQPDRRNYVPYGGVRIIVSPEVDLTAEYYYDKGKNLAFLEHEDGHKQTAVLIADYHLSKRSELYAEVDYNGLQGGYTNAATLANAYLGMKAGAHSLIGASAGFRTTF